MKPLNSLTKFYIKLSNFGKVLFFTAALLIMVVFFKALKPVKEGMTTSDKFLFKQGTAVYDDFYAGIYDYLVFSGLKNDFEVGQIINSSAPTEASIIADIGCGTGHQTSILSSK